MIDVFVSASAETAMFESEMVAGIAFVAMVSELPVVTASEPEVVVVPASIAVVL